MAEGQRHPVFPQRSDVALEPVVQVLQYEGQRVTSFVDVADEEGFLYLCEVSSKDGQRVALNDHAGEPSARHTYDGVVTAIREQLSFDALHRAIQPQGCWESTSFAAKGSRPDVFIAGDDTRATGAVVE